MFPKKFIFRVENSEEMSLKDQKHLHNFYAFMENLHHGSQYLKTINGLKITKDSFFENIEDCFQNLEKYRQHLNVKKKHLQEIPIYF